MGFSWGGGATHNLLQRINEDLRNPQPIFTNAFAVPFTAYVDAIVHGSAPRLVFQEGRVTTEPPRAETRLPPLSQFHANYYQVIDQDSAPGPTPIRGAPVQGSNIDRDVNAPPPFNPNVQLNHRDVDDDPAVQNALRNNLLRQVPIR